MKRRWCYVVGVLGALVLLGEGIGYLMPQAPPAQVTCTVANAASEDLREVTVTIYGKAYRAEGLPPGSSFTFAFDAGTDAHYTVHAKLASGRKPAAEVGYVTTGLSQADRIEVTDDGIRLRTETGSPEDR